MSDPYRPSNYAPTYKPSSYVTNDPTYASGALTTRPQSSDRYDDGRPYYPSQSNLELSQNTYHRRTSDTYLSPTDDYPSHRHSSHKSKSSRSHSRHRDDKDKDKSGRSRSHSRGKEWGATAVGGAAGAFLGNEIGHGPLGIGAGLIAGAIGAHELERRHEKHQEKKRLEKDGGGRGDRGDGDRKHHRRRSSGGLLSEVKEKVEGFLNPEGEKEKRRSRSSVGGSSGGRRRSGYDSYSDSEEERYVGRSGTGGRRRDDY
ncbi:hypothetical protein JMJ35_003980 [Cladonia borealis]|uniref:Glycine zipper 2TM domain-containing protein n=1 Tax=Cladonia borealis TaxID=184061 RepID=A0AA39R3X6_9LECA|nr:hypothetical protein JMJ35_003980 [Cladonia borealis]